MKILLTGATGYIGKRLLPVLIEAGHEVVCCVRDLKRIPDEIKNNSNCSFLKIDFLKKRSQELPTDIDIAYYLIHYMTSNEDDFSALEKNVLRISKI